MLSVLTKSNINKQVCGEWQEAYASHTSSHYANRSVLARDFFCFGRRLINFFCFVWQEAYQRRNANRCELGRNFFNSTIHFKRQRGNHYQTTPNGGYRSVRRLQISEGHTDLTVIANADPRGEWRIVSESSPSSRNLSLRIEAPFLIRAYNSTAPGLQAAATAGGAGGAGGAAILDAPAVASEATASAYEGASAAAATVSEAP